MKQLLFALLFIPALLFAQEDQLQGSSLSYYIFINRPLCYKLFIIGDGINMDIPILSE